MTLSDQTLLDRFATSRDGDSFAELVRRHSGMVYGVCRRVLQDRGLAEDAAQETFLHLLRHPAMVRESVVGWLHRVAHHKAVDLLRNEVAVARRARSAAATTGEAAAEEPDWTSISPLIDEALQALPDEARTILIAHYLEARSQQELAQELALSQPTVSRRLAAAVAQLRGVLIAKGVVATAALACLIQGTASAAAPATLTIELGKLTLAGQAGLGAGPATAATGAAVSTAKAAGSASAIGASLPLIALTAGAIAVCGWAVHHAAAARTSAASSLTAWRFVDPSVPAMAPRPMPAAPDSTLGGRGPAHLLALSRLAGAGDDAVVGVAIAPDWTVLVAGNGAANALPPHDAASIGAPAGVLPGSGGAPGGSGGSIIRLTADGRTVLGATRFPAGVALKRLRSDAHGDLLVAGVNAAGADLGGGAGSGGFIAKLSADARQLMWILYRDGMVDHAADANGDLLVLESGRLTRYDSTDGHERWHATWKGHGLDHPGALAVDGISGVAVVAGSSEAATGDERFALPYAHAFDRAGALCWSLWDEDPALLRSRPPGLHLTAEGAARRVIANAGSITLAMTSSGGNSVLAQDARDPGRPPAAGIVAGVHQATPGYGFSGTTPVATLVRVDPVRGAVLGQTWISSWRSPAQAGAWDLGDACVDGGLLCVVGESAAGGPAREAWYPASPGGQAGGSIALFGAGMQLLQAGTFPQARWTCAALRGGTLVVAGAVGSGAGVRTDHAVQDAPGPGRDGYVAVFSIDRSQLPGSPP